MDEGDNPYTPPKVPFELIPSSVPRRIPYGMIAFVGMGVRNIVPGICGDDPVRCPVTLGI